MVPFYFAHHLGGRRFEESKRGEWDSSNERSMVNHLTAIDCDTLVDIMIADIAKESPFMKDILITTSCLRADFVTSPLLAVADDVWVGFVIDALSLMERRELIRRHGATE